MAVKHYAFIKRGIVRLKAYREENDLPTGQDWREITGPEPEIGSVALSDGTYNESPYPKYEIRNDVFYNLFTTVEQETFEASDNAKVKWFLRQITIRKSIPVMPWIESTLTAMESAGMLAAGRASEIVSSIHGFREVISR